MTMRVCVAITLGALLLAQDVSPISGGVREIIVAHGDTWTSIGARHGVTPAVLARRNRRTLRDALNSGDTIIVDNHHIAPRVEEASIVVNVPQRMLFHWVDGALRASYPVAVGQRGWETPLGAFTVLSLETDPTWDVPASIQEEMRRDNKPVLTAVPPGPENPLGGHWIALTMPGIGLHGTNAPASIFRAVTHGCIRLHPDDITDLYSRVAPADRGRMIYEPVLATVADDVVWLEVHPDVYRRVPNMDRLAWDAIGRAGASSLADPARVREAVRDRAGIAVDVTAAR